MDLRSFFTKLGLIKTALSCTQRRTKKRNKHKYQSTTLSAIDLTSELLSPLQNSQATFNAVVNVFFKRISTGS